MAEQKLFRVIGKAENVFPGDHGDPLAVDYQAFVVAESPEEAIEKAFAAARKRVEDFPSRMEEWRQGNGLLPFPPDIPSLREKWRAKEVLVPGYEIILRPSVGADLAKENGPRSS